MRSHFTLFPISCQSEIDICCYSLFYGSMVLIFASFSFHLNYLAVQVYTFVSYAKSFGKCIKRINKDIYILSRTE